MYGIDDIIIISQMFGRSKKFCQSADTKEENTGVMEQHVEEILARFELEGMPVFCQSWGQGHINVSKLVETDAGRRYILQKINHGIFCDVDALMENIRRVTEHLKRKNPDPRSVLQIVPTLDGRLYTEIQGEYWRIYDYIENSLCLQNPETEEDFYESAVGFGRFQQELLDFPADWLHETIPNFHNTPLRCLAFRQTIERDPMGRKKLVPGEIAFALGREEALGTLQAALDCGSLPLRVTHNDTKLNNVLLDAETRKALCVIDLDTVMPGSSVYDFGDAIRFGGSLVGEDTTHPETVQLCLSRFRAFTRGYLSACPDLTANELEMLPMGAWTMTMECGIRFLADYLDGDHYYATQRPGQNLDRARSQFALAADMEKKWHDMTRIIKEEAR